MEPKIRTRITNLIARLAGSPDYDPKVKLKTPIEFYLNKYIEQPVPKISISSSLLDGRQHDLTITENTINRIITTGLAQIYIEEIKTTYTCLAIFLDSGKYVTLACNATEDVNDFPAAGAESLIIRIRHYNGNYTITGMLTQT